VSRWRPFQDEKSCAVCISAHIKILNSRLTHIGLPNRGELKDMAFLFEFEANSEERHLCISMEVRLKLDLCGVKAQVSQGHTLS
jgi:hypothetical protein